MKMYVWNSEAFAESNEGKICVMAENIETARQKVVTNYNHYANGYYAEAVIKDIANEPMEIENGIFCVIGY